MTLGFKLYLSDVCDDNVLREAIVTHMRDVALSDDENAADMVVTGEMLPSFPMKVGSALDALEKNIFERRYPDTMTYADYQLDWREGVLQVSGQEITLTDREKDLMMAFMSSDKGACSRDDLLQKIWGYRTDLETHALETQIYRLRQKLENDPENPKRLVTIEKGYHLV